MTKVIELDKDTLDSEWVDLMMAAREQGLTIEEIRSFLKESLKD